MAGLADLATQYQHRVSRLLGCLNRVEAAQSNGDLKALDADLLYESTFITAVALFESMLEDLLVEAVCGPRGRAGNYAIVTARSRDRFRIVLRQGKAYVDLMPFKRVIDCARLYVNDGQPFASVPDADRSLLAQVQYTRNAIAHRSESATNEFKVKVPGVGSLPVNRQRPGPFLRTSYRTNPRQSRSELYLGTMARIASDVASSW